MNAGIRVPSGSTKAEIWEFTEDQDEILAAKDKDLIFAETFEELHDKLDLIQGGNVTGMTYFKPGGYGHKDRLCSTEEPTVKSRDPKDWIKPAIEFGVVTVLHSFNNSPRDADLKEELLDQGCILQNYHSYHTCRLEYNPKKVKRMRSARKAARKRVRKKGQIKKYTLHDFAHLLFTHALVRIRKNHNESNYWGTIRIHVYVKESRACLFQDIALGIDLAKSLDRMDSLRRCKKYKDYINECHEYYEGLMNRDCKKYNKFGRWVKREYNLINKKRRQKCQKRRKQRS